MDCTSVAAGSLAVGLLLSTAVNLSFPSVNSPHPSVTRYTLVTMYGLFAQPVPPLLFSLNNVTVGDASQLSASSVTPLGSEAGISSMHCTSVAAGSLAVGLVLSTAVNVCVTSVKLPQSSVTRYTLVTMYGLFAQPVPPLLFSLNKITFCDSSQLSASSVT